MASRRKGTRKERHAGLEAGEALRMYNAAMKRADDERKAARATRRADKRRREAAEALQRVRDDPAAGPDDIEAAESHYREMVGEWNSVSGGADGGDPAG